MTNEIMFDAIANIHGRKIRLEYKVPLVSGPLGTDAYYHDVRDKCLELATENAEKDIMTGRMDEYHRFGDGDNGLPYMFIGHFNHNRGDYDRLWRVDLIGEVNTRRDGMEFILGEPDYDGDCEVLDVIPNEKVRNEWLSMAYRITQII